MAPDAGGVAEREGIVKKNIMKNNVILLSVRTPL